MIKTTKIDTPLGEMIGAATDEGVCLLEFSDRWTLAKEFKNLTRLLNTPIEEGDNPHLKALSIQLNEYFNGSRKEFTIPLVTPGTEFQKSAWKELLKIPFGTTISYMEQAVSLNRPDSVRAIANANGMNRVSILIPCHRVVGTDGQLKGYTGGLKRKRWLLFHEKKYSGKAVDLTLF